MRAFLTVPSGVPEEIEAVFFSTFKEAEAARIQAAMKGMFCTNLLVNTARHASGEIFGRDLTEGMSCPLPGAGGCCDD